MQHKISFEPEIPFLCVRGEGVVTFEDFIRYFQDIVAHPQWRSDLDTLHDLRAIDPRSVTSGAVREMAAYYAQHGVQLGTGRSALVVSEALAFGLARMWSSWASPKVARSIRIFHKIEDARAWLLEKEAA